MKKIALLTLLLINLSLSFSLPRNQASPAIFSVTQSAGTILFRHTDSTQTIIPCQSVASIVSNADPSKIVSVWVVQQGDYDKIMQFDYSVCGFSTKQEAVDSVTVWASCLYVSDSAYTTILYTNTDSATITSYDVLNSQNAPPGSPATGDTYLVGTSPSGAWVGHAKDIAEWNGSSWDFTDGVQGDFLYNATTALTYIFRSGNWVQTTGIPALNNGNTISSGLRIGTNNARSLKFETANLERGRIDSLGRYYIYDTSLRYSNKYIQVDSLTGRLIATEIPYNDGFIPLSGTEAGKPVTGDIEFSSGALLKHINENEDAYNTINIASAGIGLTYAEDATTSTQLSILNDYVGVSAQNNDAGFRGLTGALDYSTLIGSLDYPQKIYVGFRGTATLSSGTVTVTTDKIKTGYKIYVSVNTPSGTQGFLSAPTGSIVDATSFVINSTNAGDNSTVNWWIAP